MATSSVLTVGLQISAHSEMQVRHLWSHEMDQKIEKKDFKRGGKKLKGTEIFLQVFVPSL